ncbi:hypothetical protein DER46DRAFT_581885 [Fusarium sp. MPI-SDFR-AT-0072]|nr:hypothetical protein DER46DRAFT_581885 [Fusarium sp. MPI-SDFR-AT-0072]
MEFGSTPSHVQLRRQVDIAHRPRIVAICVYTSSAWQIDYLTSIMVKPQGHSAHHPMKSSSSSAPRGSLSKGAQVGIIIAAVIVGLLLITFCYYAIQEQRRARNEQDIFSWNRVTCKTLSAAVHLWIFLPVSRVLKRRNALKDNYEEKLSLETMDRRQIRTKRERV